MNKYLLIIIVILIIIISILGYQLNQKNNKEEYVTNSIKVNTISSLYQLNEDLQRFSKQETLSLRSSDYGNIYQKIGVIRNLAILVTQSGLLSTYESGELLKLERFLLNLEYFLQQISQYQTTLEPFKLGTCERVEFENEQDILVELNSFNELLSFAESNPDIEEQWNYLIYEWSPEIKLYCDSWVSPLIK